MTEHTLRHVTSYPLAAVILADGVFLMCDNQQHSRWTVCMLSNTHLGGFPSTPTKFRTVILGHCGMLYK